MEALNFKVEKLISGLELHKFGQKYPTTSGPTVTVSKNESLLNMTKAILGFPIRQIVQSERSDFNHMLGSAARFATQTDFAPEDFKHFIDPFVDDKNKVALEGDLKIEVKSVEEKREVKELVKRYSSAITNLGGFARHLPMLTDELMMNALYTAPLEYERQFSEVPPPPNCTLHFFHSQNYLSVCSSDNYGSLDRTKLLKCLIDIYKNPDEVKPREDRSQGAGIGCKLIIDHSHAFYCYCNHKNLTLVGFTVNLNYKVKENLVTPKNLHFL